MVDIVDDWTVEDTKVAREILSELGFSQNESLEPGSDRRRDNVARIIGRHMDRLRAEVATAYARGVEEAAKVADTLLYPDETKVSAQIRDAIRALAPSPWRLVEGDQPPPHNTPVLLWEPPSLTRPDGRFEAGPFSTGRRQGEYSQHGYATHYMLLPEPPQGDA